MAALIIANFEKMMFIDLGSYTDIMEDFNDK